MLKEPSGPGCSKVGLHEPLSEVLIFLVSAVFFPKDILSILLFYQIQSLRSIDYFISQKTVTLAGI